MTRLFHRLTKLQNPLMRWLLRSPLHSLVSRFFMLIIVTGRKSGKQYEIPVQYHQEANHLWVVTSESYTWWRNLSGGAMVSIMLRGRKYEACATPFLKREAVIAALKRIYPAFSTERATQIAQQAIALEIQLQEV